MGRLQKVIDQELVLPGGHVLPDYGGGGTAVQQQDVGLQVRVKFVFAPAEYFDLFTPTVSCSSFVGTCVQITMLLMQPTIQSKPISCFAQNLLLTGNLVLPRVVA